jgi:hypothetical protein
MPVTPYRIGVQAPSGTALPAFFLPAKSINTAVVVITVDLSKPSLALDTCLTWLERTRNALNEQYKLLEKRGSPLPARLKARAARISAAAANSLGKQSFSDDGISYTGIQVIICGTKYDQIRHKDLALKATLAKALRCVAHANGAHLLYTGFGSSKRSGMAGGEASETEEMAKKAKLLLTHALFSGHDRKLYVPTTAAPIVLLQPYIYVPRSTTKVELLLSCCTHQSFKGRPGHAAPTFC